MKILLHELFLLKVQKQVHQLLKSKNKYFENTTNLASPYMDWKLSDFENLSEIINSKTITGGKNIISVSTLQRIFGHKDKNKSFKIQPKNKQVLALFLEYECWEKLELALFHLLSDKIVLDNEVRKKVSQILIDIL